MEADPAGMQRDHGDLLIILHTRSAEYGLDVAASESGICDRFWDR